MADCGGDQRKSRQDWKRKQGQSASEGIIKKVKGDDAERRLAKQRECMANHRARETGKQRCQQVISIIGSLNNRILPAQVTLSLSRHLCFSCQTSKLKLLTSSFAHHPCVTKVHAALHLHVRTLIKLATLGFWVNLHLVLSYNIAVATLYFETQGRRNRGATGASYSRWL